MTNQSLNTSEPRRMILTGGSSGLGAEIARLADEDGYEVAVLDRVSAPVGKWFQVDLADTDSATQAAEDAVQHFGGAEAVVLCAGVNLPGYFIDQPFDEWKRVITINLLGNAAVARATLPALETSTGQIVGIGSTASRRLKKGMSAYGVSKHALRSLTHALALELNGRVAVTSVHPGVMDTNFFDGRPAEFVPPEDRLHPADVARTVLYCLSQPPRVTVRDLFITDLAVEDWP